MFPTLLQIGPVYISSLGFFSFLAFLFGAFVIWRKAKDEGFDEEGILDLWIASMLAGFLAGRLLFCLTNPVCWNKPFFGFFSLVKLPGFSIFGAFLGIISTWAVLSKRQKWDFWKLVDVAVFAIVAAQIFWRLGQFLDGSFFGKTTSLPWGLHFPAVEGARHPLQIYEALALILFYRFLLKLERRYRLFSWYQDKRGEAKPGFLILTYFLFYGLWRLGLEFLHQSSLYFEGIAWEQMASFVVIMAAFIGFWARSGRELRINFIFLLRKKKRLKTLIPVEKSVGRRRRKFKKVKHIKTGLDIKEK